MCRRKWTLRQDWNIICGVQSYGVGQWRKIKKFPIFQPNRFTGVKIKDRWRTMVKNKLVIIDSNKTLTGINFCFKPFLKSCANHENNNKVSDNRKSTQQKSSLHTESQKEQQPVLRTNESENTNPIQDHELPTLLADDKQGLNFTTEVRNSNIQQGMQHNTSSQELLSIINKSLHCSAKKDQVLVEKEHLYKVVNDMLGILTNQMTSRETFKGKPNVEMQGCNSKYKKFRSRLRRRTALDISADTNHKKVEKTRSASLGSGFKSLR